MSNDLEPASSDAASTESASALESRYRRLLRLLPLGYRALREDEMVDAFLAAQREADPENFDLTLKHGAPSWSERIAVARLAVRSRLGAEVAPERFQVRAEAARHTLLVAVTMLWLMAAFLAVGTLLVAFVPPVDPSGESYRILFGPALGTWTWFERWLFVAWLPTLPLAVFGARRGLQIAAACAAVPTAVTAYRTVAWPAMGISAWIGLAISVAVVAGLVLAARRPDPRAPRYGYLIGAGCVVAAVTALMLAAFLLPEFGRTLFESPVGYIIGFNTGWWAISALVGLLVLLAHQLRTRGHTRAQVDAGDGIAATGLPGSATAADAGKWLGVASVGAVATVYGLADAWDVVPGALRGLGWGPAAQSLAVAKLAQIVIAALVTVIAAIAAARRFRQLPTPRYAGAPDPHRGVS